MPACGLLPPLSKLFPSPCPLFFLALGCSHMYALVHTHKDTLTHTHTQPPVCLLVMLIQAAFWWRQAWSPPDGAARAHQQDGGACQPAVRQQQVSALKSRHCYVLPLWGGCCCDTSPWVPKLTAPQQWLPAGPVTLAGLRPDDQLVSTGSSRLWLPG